MAKEAEEREVAPMDMLCEDGSVVGRAWWAAVGGPMILHTQVIYIPV
jgi:hypothetical protein